MLHKFCSRALCDEECAGGVTRGVFGGVTAYAYGG